MSKSELEGAVPNLSFSVVSGKTIHRLLERNIEGCMDVVRRAYLAHGRGDSINPNSYFLRYPENPTARIIALPAHLGDSFQVSGIKWISSFPSNLKRGIPRASAALLLNDAETGYPFACLESSIISAARTAASAVLAAEQLNGRRRHIESLGIIGNGLISRYIYTFFVRSGWEIDEVHLFDTTPGESKRFSEKVIDAKRHKKIVIDENVESLLRSSAMTVFATTAAAPFVTDTSLFEHKPILLGVSLRDLSPDVILSGWNVVDDIGHVMNANTSVHLTEQRVGNRDFVAGTLPDLLEDRVKVPTDVLRIFSPFGLGVLDLAVGHWVYESARASGDAVTIDDFFYDLER